MSICTEAVRSASAILQRLGDGSVQGTVRLMGRIGITDYYWDARVVRVDGEVDRRTLSASASS